MSGTVDARLLVERRGLIAFARINRPEKANALDSALLRELDDFARALSDPESELGGCRAAIIAGSGERAFSAGADIADLAGLSASAAEAHMHRGQRVMDRLEDAPQLIVACIRGVALGGGLELAMACDLRVAAPDAKLGLPEITLANVPGWGGTQRLPRLIGEGRALEMIVTGKTVSGADAAGIGLVNAVSTEPETAAEELVARVSASSATAVALAKSSIYAGIRHGGHYGLAEEAAAVGACCETDEQRSAVAAFLDR